MKIQPKFQKTNQKALKTFLFKLSLIIFSVFFFQNLFAGESDQLYKSGEQAFKRNNYALALKNLSSYYFLNEVEINKNQKFKNSIIRNMSISLKRLKLQPKLKISKNPLRSSSISGDGKIISAKEKDGSPPADSSSLTGQGVRKGEVNTPVSTEISGIAREIVPPNPVGSSSISGQEAIGKFKSPTKTTK